MQIQGKQHIAQGRGRALFCKEATAELASFHLFFLVLLRMERKIKDLDPLGVLLFQGHNQLVKQPHLFRSLGKRLGRNSQKMDRRHSIAQDFVCQGGILLKDQVGISAPSQFTKTQPKNHSASPFPDNVGGGPAGKLGNRQDDRRVYEKLDRSVGLGTQQKLGEAVSSLALIAKKFVTYEEYTIFHWS